MNQLTELNSTSHKNLKVRKLAALENAKNMHMINLRVSEVPKMVASLPVFISKSTGAADWTLSTMTSFIPEQNLFVNGENWDALYQPISIQTFPFYLMSDPNNSKGYTIGIWEESTAFSESEGEGLFDKNGRASLYLTERSKLIESSISEDIQTYQFLQKLDSLALIKSVDLLIQYQDRTTQVLKGRHTVDEDKLQVLSSSTLEALNRLGYLSPINAILHSIFQLNHLVKRNNQIGSLEKIEQVKLEIARDRSGI